MHTLGNGLHAAGADFIHGCTYNKVREAGEFSSLPGWCLAQVGLDHTTHQNFIHLRRLDTGFFDPGFDTRIERIESAANIHETKNQRWDKSSVHEFAGTYGEYLINKIGKVFPDLKKNVL